MFRLFRLFRWKRRKSWSEKEVESHCIELVANYLDIDPQEMRRNTAEHLLPDDWDGGFILIKIEKAFQLGPLELIDELDKKSLGGSFDDESEPPLTVAKLISVVRDKLRKQRRLTS